MVSLDESRWTMTSRSSSSSEPLRRLRLATSSWRADSSFGFETAPEKSRPSSRPIFCPRSSISPSKRFCSRVISSSCLRAISRSASSSSSCEFTSASRAASGRAARRWVSRWISESSAWTSSRFLSASWSASTGIRRSVTALLSRSARMGERRRETEPDQDPAGHETFGAPVERTLPEPPSERGSHHGVRAVAQEPQGDEEASEKEDLKGHGAIGRIDKLRNEGEEEQRRLRIKRVQEHPLPVDPEEGRGFDFGPLPRRLRRGKPANTEIDQIGGPHVLHGIEGQGGGHQQCRQAECRGRYVDQGAGVNPQDRDEPGGPAAIHASSDDVEDGGSRHDQQGQSGRSKNGDGGRIRHVTS